MYKNLKIIILSLVLITVSILLINYNYTLASDVFKIDNNDIPKQVNIHMGDNPSNEVNLTYTTNFPSNNSKVIINEDSSHNIVLEDNSNFEMNNKYFHKLRIKNLKENTRYEYTIKCDTGLFNGSFKTAPKKESKEKFKFAYLADTQVSNNDNAKAVGATFAQLSKDLDFVFLAGDITDKSMDEKCWELIYENNGLYPTSVKDVLSNTLISVVQGNHDNNKFTEHITTPSMVGDVVYAFDYGPAKFIMLNFENIKYDEGCFKKQKDFLTKEINDAKKNDKWIFVGFHKSIYTGASHITDSDIVKIRQYWAPILANLDVDLVMQGHDHVYSRGFINKDGYNIKIKKDKKGNIIDPLNTPLYIVGGHAGGLKWYPKKNYTVIQGDPLDINYKFLDKNSNDSGGYEKKEQTFIELEVSENQILMNTYMFKYDTLNDKFSKSKYLYDSISIVKNNANIK